MAVSDGVTTRRVEIRFHSGPPSNTPGAGLVRFTPIAEYVPMAETATVDPYILLNHEFTAPLVDGLVSAEVTVTDNPLMGVRDWSWVATPELVDGQGASISGPPPFPFVVPTGEGTLNLVPFADVPASPGLGQAQIISYAIRAAEYADAAAASAASAAAGLAGSTAAADTAGQAAVRAAASAAASEGSAAAARESAAAAQQQAGTAAAAATGAQTAASSAAGMVARAESAATASGSDAAKARQAADGAAAAASVAASVKAQADAGEFKGATGPANKLAIGTVTKADTAAATITGTAPNQTLNLSLPKGDAGPAVSLAIGTVSSGTAAAATITGAAPNQSLNLTLPKGDNGVGWVPVGLTTQSLDTLTAGIYRQADGARSTVALGYPYDKFAGIIKTANWGATELIQEAIPIPVSTTVGIVGTYLRGYRSGWWGAWTFIPKQRVDNTAGRAVYTWDDTASREQLISGDTGWRTFGDLILPGFEFISIIGRRDRYTVTVLFDAVKSATASGHVGFVRMPEGFRADTTSGTGNMRYGLATELTGGNPRVISPDSNSTNIRLLSYTSGLTLHGGFTFFTKDAWPTTLPGTAVGTIPNA